MLPLGTVVRPLLPSHPWRRRAPRRGASFARHAVRVRALRSGPGSCPTRLRAARKPLWPSSSRRAVTCSSERDDETHTAGPYNFFGEALHEGGDPDEEVFGNEGFQPGHRSRVSDDRRHGNDRNGNGATAQQAGKKGRERPRRDRFGNIRESASYRKKNRKSSSRTPPDRNGFGPSKANHGFGRSAGTIAVDGGEESTAWKREAERLSLEELESRLQVGDNGKGHQQRLQLEDLSVSSSISPEDLQALYPYRFDSFQMQALDSLCGNRSVLVSAPTGSGKTLIAEAAAAAALARGERVFYTTPLKALSNQKLREFEDKFGEENVGLITGDVSKNVGSASIVVMTTEILRNMLYAQAGAKTVAQEDAPRLNSNGDTRFDGVSLVVLDEVHYLSDVSRGTVWEEVIIYMPQSVRLCCLSATVGNTSELAAWISQVHAQCDFVSSNSRPVGLKWYFSRRPKLRAEGDGLVPLLSRSRTSIKSRAIEMNRILIAADMAWQGVAEAQERASMRYGVRNRDRKSMNRQMKRDEQRARRTPQYVRRQQSPTTERLIGQLLARDMLPCIWFIFSRRQCDALCNLPREVQLLSKAEFQQVDLALRKLRDADPQAVREESVNALYKGVAAHHAGCLPAWKAFVEELFQRGLIKIVFATETLAAGINMPARTTVLSSLSKRSFMGHETITTSSLLQMAGRAGRRGIDSRGYVVIMQSPFEGPEVCVDLLQKGPEPLRSQFAVSYDMVLGLLQTCKLGQARQLVERSFGNYLGGEGLRVARSELETLYQRRENLRWKLDKSNVPKNVNADSWSKFWKRRGLVEAEYKRELSVRSQLAQQRDEGLTACLEDTLSREDVDGLLVMLQFGAKRLPFPAVCVKRVSQHSARAADSEVADYIALAEKADEDESDDELSEAGTSTPQVALYLCLGVDNVWYLVSAGCISAKGPPMRMRGISSCAPQEGEWEPLQGVSGRRDEGIIAFTAAPSNIARSEEMLESSTRAEEYVRFSDNRASKDGQTASTTTAEATGEIEAERVARVLAQKKSKTSRLSLASARFIERFSPPIEFTSLVSKEVEMGLNEAIEAQAELVKNLSSELRSMLAGEADLRISVDQYRRDERRLNNANRKISDLEERVGTYEPSGFPQFQGLLNVLMQFGALTESCDSKSLAADDAGKRYELSPLGENALQIRGYNTLWLTLALADPEGGALAYANLSPPQLAALVSALVSRDVVSRSASSQIACSFEVFSAIKLLDPTARKLEEAQRANGLQEGAVPIVIDTEHAGLVEAWASGVKWEEVVASCTLDEGDVARLLRRSTDMLIQLKNTPHLDARVRKNASRAVHAMERSPITDLL